MYAPIVDSLIAGMRGRAGWKIRSYPVSPQEALHGLGEGDVLVWVGVPGLHHVRWPEARASGVRTVYYQTEPLYGVECESIPMLDEGQNAMSRSPQPTQKYGRAQTQGRGEHATHNACSVLALPV